MAKARLLTTAELGLKLDALKANDCEIDMDKEAGTATAFDGEALALTAIQKGFGGPWIVRFIDTDRITWTTPEGE